MITKDTIIYCDMDGVIADFNAEPNAVKRYDNEKGFFAKLQPLSENLETVNKLVKLGYNVNILSTSPNRQADRDKFTWLMRYLPDLKVSAVYFTRPDTEKADRLSPNANTLLIDDYTHNLAKWLEKGGNVLKLVNKYDNVNGKHIELGIKYVKSLKELL
jgi:5'(3')-deoxyribonucleotidase